MVIGKQFYLLAYGAGKTRWSETMTTLLIAFACWSAIVAVAAFAISAA